MQTIPLKNKTIDLPNSWSDLNEKQALFVFKKLSLLFAGQIEPIQFQFELLRYFTGYNPKHQKKIRSLEVGITGLMYQLFYGKKHYRDLLYSERKIQENITYNLIQLSEKINFVFKIENENKIVPLYDFKRNPFYKTLSVYFNRDITVETNITAKQYVDCVDLLIAINNVEDEVMKKHCMIKIVAILNGFSEKEAKKKSPYFIFGTVFWFTSIYRFFKEHPIYSILYSGKERDENSISLGMSEILLYLEKEGYDFSFSGIKSGVLNYLNQAKQKGQTINPADVAASFQEAVIDVLVDKSVMAVKQFGFNKLVIAGGVAANSRLRERLTEASQEHDFSFYSPSIKLCTDNAAMIGSAAYYTKPDEYQQNLALNANPNLRI